MSDAMQRALQPLLDHIAAAGETSPEWRGWRITRIGGGQNNLLYRASGEAGDYAVKFTIRDARDRAGREYAALHVLQQSGLSIAPAPILLERHRYAQPVVVQTWLEGDVSAAPPVTDTEWLALVKHISLAHAITPDKTSFPLPRAMLGATSAEEGRDLIRQQLAHMPAEARPLSLRALAQHFEKARLPDWPAPPLALCRVDLSPLNFIRRPAVWASVDWENSGWGDAAFDFAELIAHPAYREVAAHRWEWVIRAYCDLSGQAGIAERVAVYRRVLLVWWAARLARYLYEVPRGNDQRLVERPDDWQADIQAKFEHYVQIAQAEALQGA